MQTTKVFRLLIGKDVAVDATTATAANATNGAIVPFSEDWAELLTSDTIATTPIVYLLQKVTNSSDAKIGSIVSLPIHGQYVRGFRGESFRPGQEQITYFGLVPSATTIAAGTGDVTATVGADYSVSILMIDEKEKFQSPYRYYYTLPTSGTKLTLLVEFARQINNDTVCPVTARVIGNGTGTDGLTSATAYGLQLKGDDPKYYFSVGISDTFATTVSTDTKSYRGNGTTALLTEKEDIGRGYLGYMNRIMLPKTITDDVVDQSNSVIGDTGATGTVTFTQNSKVMTTPSGDLSSSSFAAGDKIVVNGVTYGIASVTADVTGLVLTEPFRASTVTYTASGSVFATSDIAKVEGYDLVVVDHDIPFSSQDNQNINPKSCQTIVALPSYIANATAKSTFLGALNAWMITTPGRFANVTV